VEIFNFYEIVSIDIPKEKIAVSKQRIAYHILVFLRSDFRTLAIALIEKNANRIVDAARACFLKLGKRDLIPLPIIAPCNNPIPITTAKVSK